MSDLIDRQDAIYAVEESRRLNHHKDGKEACAHEYEHRHFLKILRDLPSAQPEERALHESCTDCPLYDKDRHSCPRFNKVIPETLREVQSAQQEPAIPLSWIETHIAWIKSLDNAFSYLTALQISTMVEKWKDEQDGTV